MILGFVLEARIQREHRVTLLSLVLLQRDGIHEEAMGGHGPRFVGGASIGS